MSIDDLAINGGTPVRTKPWQESDAIGIEEKQAVERVMEKGDLSLFLGCYESEGSFSFLGGSEVQGLEEMAKKIIGSQNVISVNSATSGLTSAVGALGIGFGDEVIVSPYTMSACVVAPLWWGAIPIFADVERETGCLDPVSIEENITERTKAILVVHQFGIPADMDAIMRIAKEHDIKVIEDCAQAWGAKFNGNDVGTIGDIGVFSFNVHKTIQCGEGGLCVTNDDELALRLQLIRNHGESVAGPAQYENITNIVGSNYRMTEMQAAVAQAQLKKLDILNIKRIALAEELNRGLAPLPCLAPPKLDKKRHATYYIYPLRYLSDQLGGLSRSDFARMLTAEGISFGEGYMEPLYMLPLFQKRIAFTKGYPWSAPENQESKPKYNKGTCPIAELLYKDEMLLSQYIIPPQTTEDMQDIVRAAEKIVKVCS